MLFMWNRRGMSLSKAGVLPAALATILLVSACASGATPTKAAATSPGGATNAAISSNAAAAGAGVPRSGIANGTGSYAQIMPSNGSGQYGIWVSGAGRVTVKPNVGILSFGVEAREATVALAKNRAASAMTGALKALADHKVADKDIQTQQFSIYPIIVYTQTKTGDSTPQITGYVVTNQATAKIRALDTVGDVIDAVAAGGSDNIRINSIGFTIENPKPLEDQARALALQDAMAKAQQIAQVTGVKLGAPFYISESGGSPVVAQRNFAAGAASQASAPTPINPGNSEVNIQVQMVFAIQ